MIKSEIKNMLVSVSDEKYRAFTEKLKSSNSAVLGVRMGVLRKTAKELAKENWKEYNEEENFISNDLAFEMENLGI